MNILINCPFKFNINNSHHKKLGGIESLSIDLAKSLSLKKYNVTLSTICKKPSFKNNVKNIPLNKIKNNPQKFHFDKIISSNDATIFNYFPNSKKFLWLHNPLQLEKAMRKGQLLSIIRNRPTTIFVSDYLKTITSSLFFFTKKITINNFLLNDFILKKIDTKKREPIIIWSVARNKGLNETIKMWINQVYPEMNMAKLFILGVNKLPNNLNKNYLKSKNIYFKGRVSRDVLKKIYLKSSAMICLGYDETFCLNALEANACGLPILSFGKTALSKFIINKYNGFIVKDFKSLSDKIKTFLKFDKKNKQKILNNSFNHSKKFTIDNSLFYWLKLLK